jgi:cytochrome c556
MHGGRHMRAGTRLEGQRAMLAMGIDGHQAASGFARLAASGDREKAIAALPSLTAACVACHHAYRIR